MFKKNIIEEVVYTDGAKKEIKFKKEQLKDGRIMFSTNAFGIGFMCDSAEPNTDKYKELEEQYERIKDIYICIGFYKKEA